MSELSDQEIFDAAISGETRPEAPAEIAHVPEVVTEQPAPVETNRDDKGRFAPSSEQAPTTEVQPEANPAREPAIPPSRLREEAEARRRSEAENADLRARLQALERQQTPVQPTPAPDIFENPDAWADQRLNPVVSEVREIREEFSRRFAEQAYGPEKVNEAYQALDQAIRTGKIDGRLVKSQLESSKDPFADIMAWHQRDSILSEIGTDPKAYEQKVIERWLADPANAAKLLGAPQQPAALAPAPAGQTVRLPPSLNRSTSAASSAPGAANDMSDQGMFDATISRRR